jgi:uncharacterized protein (TIGR02246 family)
LRFEKLGSKDGNYFDRLGSEQLSNFATVSCFKSCPWGTLAGEERMRAFLSLVALLALLTSAANAGPKEDALAVLEKWAKAFAASDVDGIVKLYAPDALFMGTTSKTVVVKPEGIRSYFENALLNNRPRGATLNSYEALVLSDTAVVITGLDTLTGVRNGQPLNTNGRVTFVIEKRGSDWQIVHFHRSAMPN